YDDAKNEQMLLEHRIATLEERLRDARVISKKDIAKDVVSVGSKVKLRDVAAKETIEYHIVGSAEANPAENKLSNESPVGKAITGFPFIPTCSCARCACFGARGACVRRSTTHSVVPRWSFRRSSGSAFRSRSSSAPATRARARR